MKKRLGIVVAVVMIAVFCMGLGIAAAADQPINPHARDRAQRRMKMGCLQK